MLRRLADVLAGILALVLTGPVILVLGLAVRLQSPGPAFFGGPRVGKDGRVFKLWKLRTMVSDAYHAGPSITAKDDPRITRLGARLRGARLDELPQFWNLLVGDVTLIGPRAEDPEILKRYAPEHRWVLSVKPGLTGPGTLYYARHQEDTLPEGEASEEHYLGHLLDEKLRIDREYLDRQTLGSDLGILFRTAGYALSAFARRADRAAAR
jgi:lipopolysaccharide/colanic/teichoic acid biosynthesis glycosyltransferase